MKLHEKIVSNVIDCADLFVWYRVYPVSFNRQPGDAQYGFDQYCGL